MNLINKITNRIEERRTENKNPCKNYATEEAAEAATKKMAEECADYFQINDVDYIVFYIKSWGRWVGAIDFTRMFAKYPDAIGGYLGIAADKGFYTY